MTDTALACGYVREVCVNAPVNAPDRNALSTSGALCQFSPGTVEGWAPNPPVPPRSA